jgi:sporulation protein YunB
MRFSLKPRVVMLRIPPYKRYLLDFLVGLGLLLLGLVAIFYLIDYKIRPTLIQLVKVKAVEIATHAINESIRANIVPDLNYANLIKIQLNAAGEISLLQPNTGEINRIATEATLAVQKRLTELPKMVIKIPLGQVMGSRILGAYGPMLPVKVIPVGLVYSKINDTFDAAGINQTRHRIFLHVQAKIRMIVPLVNQEFQVSTEVPLTEAIVVGKIPNTYAAGGGILLGK